MRLRVRLGLGARLMAMTLLLGAGWITVLEHPRGQAASQGESGYPADWPTFQASPARTGSVQARTVTNPIVLWATEVGTQTWLNNPIIVGSRVFVGSSGSRWNRPDASDGVYSLDLSSGDILWFTPAENDVNGVAYGEGLIVATGDEGAVWALEADSGEIRWRQAVSRGKMYTNPLFVGGLAVVGNARGILYAFDLKTGTLKWSKRLRGAIRGGASSDGATIYAGSTKGDVVALGLDGTERWRILLLHPSFDRKREEPAEIYAAPTVVGGLVVIGFVRDTYYDEPALVAIDRATGAIRWRASNPTKLEGGWGNIRSSPAAYKDLLIYGEPYSNRVVAVGVRDGRVRWSSAVGFPMFPHWPSPAVVGSMALIPRHDGGLYALEAATGHPLWSLYLGDAPQAGTDFPGNIMPPDWEDCAWQPNVGRSIFASPAIAKNGLVVVGTDQGFLFCVGDSSWRDVGETDSRIHG